MKLRFVLLLILTQMGILFSQKNYIFKGYVKDLFNMQKIERNNLNLENTIHNRLDLDYYLNDNLTFTAGMRNRFIYSNNYNLYPNYAERIATKLGYTNLSLLWLDNNKFVGVSQLDRLFLDYTIGNFQVTLGRQRINWGQTFIWNANDVFNTYSFFDFDYEERAGTDALRLQYYVGDADKIELSTSINKDKKITSAFLYRINRLGYDLQGITGIFTESDYMLGGGWSGEIKGIGFSGEITYFHPMEKDSINNRKGNITFSTNFNYTFSNSINFQIETLYNSFDNSEVLDINNFSPKNLFITNYAVFSALGKDITPLFRIDLSGMHGYSENIEFIFIGPTFKYSLSDNSEVNLIGQIYNYQNQNIVSLFGRLRYSF